MEPMCFGWIDSTTKNLIVGLPPQNWHLGERAVFDLNQIRDAVGNDKDILKV